MNRVQISAFFFLSILSCSSPQVTAYKEHSEHSEFIASCLNFLAGNDSYIPLSDPSALEELKHAAEEHASNSIVIGDLFYDLNVGESRHFYLSKDDELRYYRPRVVVLGGWEMVQHLCARHIRHEVERGFFKTGSILRKDADSDLEMEMAAEENFELYLKLAEVSKGKPSHIRNFLFISLSKFVKRKERIHIPSCNLLERLKNPILSGLESARRNRQATTAWTEMMLAVTNYSAAHAQECLASGEGGARSVRKAGSKNKTRKSSRARSYSKKRSRRG